MNEHCRDFGSLFGLCPKRGRRKPRYNLYSLASSRAGYPLAGAGVSSGFARRGGDVSPGIIYIL